MKPQIYIFSIFNWNSKLLHREHMISKALVELGFRVFFVERKFGFSRSKNIDGVDVISVFSFPYMKGISKVIFKINDKLLGLQTEHLINNDKRNMLICSSPLWSKAVIKFKTSLNRVVYDISDDHLAFATNELWRKNLTVYENYLIKKADHIVLTTTTLLYKIGKKTNYSIINNGVDLNSFKKAQPILKNDYQGKIVGFIGGLYRSIDFDLIRACAISYPNVNILLIGPSDRLNKIHELEKIKNIHYLGAISWDKIGDYFASLDVGIIPFVSEDEYPWLKTIDSVKIYQYAYFGYPIVTTKFSDNEKFKELINIAKNKSDFVKLLGKAIKGSESIDLREKRVKLAKDNDWLKLVSKMINEINNS